MLALSVPGALSAQESAASVNHLYDKFQATLDRLARDPLTAIEQALREVIADKTGRAGDQNRHALPFVMQMIWGNAKRQ